MHVHPILTLSSPFLLCARPGYSKNQWNTPCAILELSSTIPESADKVGILTMRRYNSGIVRFSLCVEHILYLYHINDIPTICLDVIYVNNYRS